MEGLLQIPEVLVDMPARGHPVQPPCGIEEGLRQDIEVLSDPVRIPLVPHLIAEIGGHIGKLLEGLEAAIPTTCEEPPVASRFVQHLVGPVLKLVGQPHQVVTASPVPLPSHRHDPCEETRQNQQSG
jgi:hypothetical protein